MRGNKKADYERPATVIGKDAIIEMGDLKSKSSVQINGVLKGNVSVDASLVVGQGGKVEGNAKAAFILVAGDISGNVKASEQLHLTKSALINGDVECASIVIDDGAVLNGSCKMTASASNDVKVSKKS